MYLFYHCEFIFIVISSAFLMTIGGCGTANSPPPLYSVNPHFDLNTRFGQIDIAEDELAQGLTRALERLSLQTGPINTELFLKDYLIFIRKELLERGFCLIRKMNVNGNTVDIDIFFRVDQDPLTLTIKAYLNGNASPALELANHYHVRKL